MDDLLMDHDHHDPHENHTMPMNGTMDTGMAFYFGTDVTILFGPWKVDNAGGLIGSMIAIAVLGVLFEALKVLRLRLAYNNLLQNPHYEVSSQVHHRKGKKTRSIDENKPLLTELGSTEEDNVEPDDVVTASFEVVQRQKYRMGMGGKLVQSLCQMVQLALGYFLMLIFMTYNAWLCFAVVIGLGAGYALMYNPQRKYAPVKSLMDGTGECHL